MIQKLTLEQNQTRHTVHTTMTTPTAGTTNSTAASLPFMTIHDHPIYFQEDWDTGIGGGLWSTGLALAQYFQSDEARNSVLLLAGNKQLRVLELGSGNGFLSVCLLAMARDVIEKLVVTDFADHLPLMETTMAANQHLMSENVEVQVKEHKWGEFDIEDNLTFDLILGSDVAYRPYLYDVLISSLSHYSNSNTISLIGVTMNDTTPAFFVKLSKAGFSYTRLNDILMPSNFQGTTFGIFVIRKKAEDRNL